MERWRKERHHPVAMVRKVAKGGAVKTDRNWSRSERKVGVSCMCGLLVARAPGCCATPRIHPSPKEDAIEHAYTPVARSAKPELRPIFEKAGIILPKAR